MTNLPFNGIFKCTCVYRKKGSWKAGFHTGIDLVGNNTNVYSVCDGTIILAKNYGDYGNTVKVKDAKTGKIFLFAHLKSIAVKVGQIVNRTTKIGVMGSTGNSTGAHLHIEMRTSADKYGEVENIADYMGIPNALGTYNSAKYQIDNQLNIKYEVHIQDIGWQEQKENGEIAGTEGQSKRIEAIKIHCEKSLKYRVHIQDIGWTEYVPNDCIAGTEGQSKRIEAIEIVTDGTYKIRAKAHIQDIGWATSTTGTIIKIGTEGRALRLEALTLEII